MLVLTIVLFIVAAVFGLINLTAVLKDRPTPSFAVLAHGVFAFIALLVLISVAASGTHKSLLLLASLGTFILAALGGLTLLSFDLRKKPIPKTLALIHPAVAVIALFLLVLYVFGY